MSGNSDRASPSQETFRLPTESLNTPEEERPEEERPEEEIVSIIGPDTPDVVMDSAVNILRMQQVGATTQTSAPPSESIIPPRIPDNITIPHVSISAPGYESVSLRSSGMALPPARTQITSVIQKLDGPRSLPTVNPIQERMGRLPDQMRQDPFQRSTYVQKTAVSRRREYPEGGGPPGGGYPGGGGPPGPPGGQGQPGPQEPAGPVRPIIVQTPQITLDTTGFGKYF